MLGILRIATARRDDFAALEQIVRYRHGGAQQSSGVIAQVDDVSLEIVVGDPTGDVGNRLPEGSIGQLVERGDADIADVAAFDPRSHGDNVNGVANDDNVEGVFQF